MTWTPGHHEARAEALPGHLGGLLGDIPADARVQLSAQGAALPADGQAGLGANGDARAQRHQGDLVRLDGPPHPGRHAIPGLVHPELLVAAGVEVRVRSLPLAVTHRVFIVTVETTALGIFAPELVELCVVLLSEKAEQVGAACSGVKCRALGLT